MVKKLKEQLNRCHEVESGCWQWMAEIFPCGRNDSYIQANFSTT
jgi:hypothetical protein